MKPNARLWGALLSSSRTHGDMELAERVVKELINYVLLSNIYIYIYIYIYMQKGGTGMKLGS